VCASGRANIYLATLALLLGHHVRIGMEDTIWRWPHRDEKINKNLETYLATKQLVELLGREVVTPEEWRKTMKMRKPGGKFKK
jgi:3-keto-5-aminohexanoate cleavage enzyme